MRKLLLLISLIVGLNLSAHAQGVSVSGTAVVNTTTSVSGIPGNRVLQAVPGAQITVCASTGGGIPCSPLVTIYSNAALTVIQPNPITADLNGNFSFFIAPNVAGYIYTQTGSGITGQLFTIAPQSTVVGGGAPTNSIDVTAAPYNAKFKVKRVSDATWTSGSNPTTVTSASANFQSGDFPASFKGVSAGVSLCTNLGSVTFVSSTQISVTCSGAGTGNPSGTGLIAWGPDDSAAINAATAAAAALCNSYHNVLLKLPVGASFINQGQLGTIPSGCTALLGSFNGGSTGFSVMGGSPGCRTCTVLLPTPGFNFSTGGAAGCFWDGVGSLASGGTYKEGFTIDGMGELLTGVSTAPCNPMFSAAVAAGNKHIGLLQWGTATSPKFKAYFAKNQAGPNIDIQIDTFGDSVLYCGLGAEISAGFAGGGFTSQDAGNAGNCTDYGNWYGGDSPSGSTVISIAPGSQFHSFGTVMQAIGGGTAGIYLSGPGASAYFDGLQMPASVPATSPMLDFGANGTIYYKNSQLLGGITAGSCINAPGVGTFINLGGNTWQGGPWLCTNTYIDESGTFPTPVACTGTATSSSTLGLYGTGPNVTATTCTSAAIGSGVQMSRAGTILALIVTATNAGVNASSGLVTVLKNGAAQTMVCTVGTGTSCSDGTTAHQVTVARGDLISVRFTTQAAEVLAGVSVTLVIM